LVDAVYASHGATDTVDEQEGGGGSGHLKVRLESPDSERRDRRITHVVVVVVVVSGKKEKEGKRTGRGPLWAPRKRSSDSRMTMKSRDNSR
jgi:hypothetical protein